MLTQKDIIQLQKNIGGGDKNLPVIFSALGDPTRFSIFRILTEKKDACVSDIANIVGVSVPAVSHHLKILEQSGLARREREGQMICYRIKEKDPVVQSIMKIINI